MSGNIYEVRPGPPQQLQGANFSSGATIYNTDILNSVWISNSQAMSPGNGFQLTPQASLEWASSKGLPWACVDTGVTDNIILQYSDDVSNVQNPVGVALAVSAAGVPVKAVEKVIYNNSFVPANDTIRVDVSNYNSVLIFTTTAPQLEYRFIEDLGHGIGPELIVDADILTLANPLSNSGVSRIACVSNQLEIINLAPFVVDLLVVGSSRQPLARIDSRYKAAAGDFWSVPSTSMVSGVSYPFSQNIENTALQGNSFASFTLSGTTVTGYFYMVFPASGNLIILQHSQDMITTASGNRVSDKIINLPPNRYSLGFHCQGVGGNASASITMSSGDTP